MTLVVPDDTSPNGVRYRRVKAEHSFFVRVADVGADLAREIRDAPRVRSIIAEGDWYRVRLTDRDSCRQLCVFLEDHGVPTFDGAISPVLRWMTDNKAAVARPRTAYLDIETDSRVPFSRKEEMRVLAWSVVDGVTGEATTRTLRASTDARERELLAELWQVLDRYDQVVAWNGDRFDFPVIKARTEQRNIHVEWKRWLWLDLLDLFRRMNMMAAESGDEKASFKLDDVCQAVLKEGKDPFDAGRTWEAWMTPACGDGCCKACRACMAAYCERDTDLMRRLELKLGYVELLFSLCDACGGFPDSRGINPSIQVETFLQRIADERGYKFPTSGHRAKRVDGKFAGAYVMDPRTDGITKNVHVVDFAGLYPSIIVSWNMSPETKVGDDFAGPSCVSPLTGVRFRTDVEGILPAALRRMLELRQKWKDAEAAAVPGTPEAFDAHRKSTAYKIAVNSFYGVIGMVLFRLFDREVAESITQCGVWLIKRTIEEAERRNIDVVYSDTDSAFCAGCTRSEMEWFVEHCNGELYPEMLAGVGCVENTIQLDCEKGFERLVIVTAKRYVGKYAYFKGTSAAADSKPEVKGLEYKRGDSIRLARQMQELVVDMLVGAEPIEDPAAFVPVLDDWQRYVMSDELSLEDVALSKRLNKPLDGYARKRKKDGTWARQLPHIEIARELLERGEDVGEGAKIDYVIVDGAATPMKVIAAQDWDGTVDRYAVWDTLVAPPTLRLLAAAFPAADWKRWKRTRPKPQRKPRGVNPGLPSQQPRRASSTATPQQQPRRASSTATPPAAPADGST